jgi:hypothetical protein
MEIATTEKATKAEKYVDLFVPKGYVNEEETLFISVNEKNYLLPRGKTSRVPLCVKEEYDRAMRAQQKLDEKSSALLEKAKQPI